MIGKYWMPELHAYIASIFNSFGHKTIIVGGMSDHVHALIRYNCNQSIPDMVMRVKKGASQWVNAGHHTMCRFAWQKGYGVFSYSQNQVNTVYNYIKNQEEHHKKKNFVDEFVNLLNTRKIEYDPEYLPTEPE